MSGIGKSPTGTLTLTEATADQILALNKNQTASTAHPFTCTNRGDGEHREFNGDLGALVATRRGWICPWCDYTQPWAYHSMAMPEESEWPSTI